MRFHLSLLAALLWLGGGCHTVSPPASPVLNRYEYTQTQMGMPFRLVLYAESQGYADRAATDAFNRIRQLNDVLSDYEFDSELSRLSRSAGSGQAVPLSPDLLKVLTASQAMAQLSDGAFDVTVGPAVSLWRKARRERRLPDPIRIETARKAMGWQFLELDAAGATALLRAPGMRLDLGGIAKGYALDEALKALARHGVRSALISGGGDMAVSAPPPGKPGWRIELAPLDVTNAPPARHVLLRHAALATSGDLFQRLEIEGRRYSHIIDPRTGVGLTDHSLVTVIAPDGMTADALSTAVSVLGPQKGGELIESIPGAAATISRQMGGRIEQKDTLLLGTFIEGKSAARSRRKADLRP
jgi:thiamine biosynthesis lipoprotein